jgi:hypothetical protein
VPEIVERYEPLYEQLGSEVSGRYGKLAARFQRHVAPLREEVEVIQDQVRQAVDDLDVDLPDLPEGEAYEDEDQGWLFDSERGFLEQTEHFREAQGRA